MSIKIMAAIWDLDLPHELSWVLMAYADHADHNGENCYPALDLIAYKTGYSRRQVSYVVAKLVAKEILIVEKPGGGRGKSTVYRIDLSKVPTKKNHASLARFPAPDEETVQTTAVNRAKTVQPTAETEQSHTGNAREPLTVNLLTTNEPIRSGPDDSPEWIRIKNELAQNLNGKNIIAAYVLPAPGRIEDETLYIYPPSHSGAQIIRQRLLWQINKASERVNGCKFEVVIVPPGDSQP